MVEVKKSVLVGDAHHVEWAAPEDEWKKINIDDGELGEWGRWIMNGGA